VTAAENRLGIKFPEDYRRYLLKPATSFSDHSNRTS
jgi:hypothetical protein